MTTPAASVSAHRLKTKSSRTGFSVHCEATWSVKKQFTQNCAPSQHSAVHSGRFSTVALVASSQTGCFARGLRAESRLGHSRAEYPLCPKLKQAPTGALTAGASAAGTAGVVDSGAEGGNTPCGFTILFGCKGTKG